MAKDTRDRMIETTARLLQHRGYHGTALSDILEQSAAPRGSLYFHFPGGKEQLALEATRVAVEETSQALRAVFAKANGPAAGIRDFIKAAADIMRHCDYTFGCPVAGVILDATPAQKELAELCRAALEEWIELIEGALRKAGIPAKRARNLAILVEASLEGSMLIARAYRDTAAMMAIATELEQVVRAAMPQPGRQTQKTKAVRVRPS